MPTTKNLPRSPLYQSLYLQLRAKIESGEYSKGAMLPSEQIIAEENGVSRSRIILSSESAIPSAAALLAVASKSPEKGSACAARESA